MLGFCIIAPIGDAFAKLLAGSIPIGQVVFVRFALEACLLLPFVWGTGRVWKIGGKVFGFAVIRACLHIAGIALMFTALRYLPLADAVAIVFVMPFFMLILGKFVLKEEVGSRRMAACVVGFIGTLLVIQPSFVEVGLPALLPVLVAANFSVFILVTRQIAKQIDPVSLQAVNSVTAVTIMAVLLGFGALTSFAPLSIITPSGTQWALLIGLGVLGTIAHLLMTWSLRFAPSATLAPMQYLEIPFATLLGLLIFQDLPNPLAGLGIAITIAAGLYIILRERATARLAALETPTPHPA